MSHLIVGFEKNQRAGDMPVCQECGALVAFESQQRHLASHERVGR